MAGDINQAILYALNCTIGRSFDLSATATSANYSFTKQGRYLITNLGPDPVNIIMHENATTTATTSDYPLFPVGSGDTSAMPVFIGAPNLHTTPKGRSILHYVCAPGNTATLRITELTKF